MRVIRPSTLLLAVSTCLSGLLVGTGVGCGTSTEGAVATLGPQGGSIALPNDAVRLDVPAGALASEVTVTLRSSTDARGLLVEVEPVQLALAKLAKMTVQLRAVHISSATEVTSGGEQPIGLDRRMEDASGTRAELRLDHFARIRLTTEAPLDGGTATGACREGDDDHQGGEHPDAGPCKDDDEERDGGEHGEHPSDGGVASADCPTGFECDDGVCVAPGGDDEHETCRADGGPVDCPVGTECEDGACVPHHKGDCDAGKCGDGFPDGGS
ncbi:MAG: hypothetical protein L3K06_09180 [Thermoplasmata archaeon]|nr:hypothetical protein [Thermoplasmata archaeon]